MKKKFLMLMLFIIMSVPNFSSALSSEEMEVVAEKTMYYKTITTRPNIETLSSSNNVLSYTVEITEEEYNNYSESIMPFSSTIETNYKRLTVSILKKDSKYRYQGVLSWKNMPATRSYDIIGLAYYSSVKPSGNPTVKQEYCINNYGCSTEKITNTQTFSNGIGATYKIPTGDLYSLSQTIYVDVEKNTSSTLKSQALAGDYAHAQKSVSYSDGQKYSMNMSGLSLDSSISGSYDDIDIAYVTWSGTW